MAADIERGINIVNPDGMIKNAQGDGGDDKFKEGEGHGEIIPVYYCSKLRL